MFLYGLLYLSGIPAVRWWLGDMNVMFCLLYAAIYESCIRCRMIPSNTGYMELFEASTLAACIADRSGQIVLRSRAAGEDMICPQDGQRIIRPDGMRISSAPISGGYAVWQDNVRPLAELHARLNENRAEMERNRKKLRDAYRVSVPDTAAATALIVAHPALFTDYEITKGKMDDVFLAVTGKKLSGGGEQ